MLDRRQIEAGEMIQLRARRIGQNGLERRRGIIAADAEANEVFVTLPVGDLDDAQPVAPGDEAHGFGIDGDIARRQHAFGQVFFVEMYSHMRGLRTIGDGREGELAQPRDPH